MKKLPVILSWILLASISQASDDLSWVDEQIDAIKPPRTGIQNQYVAHVRDPFIFLEKNKTIKEKKVPSPRSEQIVKAAPIVQVNTAEVKNIPEGKFLLTAIMNQSVLINGQWYKKGDKVNEYVISEIGNRNVVLKQNSKSIVLSTDSPTNNLKFKK